MKVQTVEDRLVALERRLEVVERRNGLGPRPARPPRPAPVGRGAPAAPLPVQRPASPTMSLEDLVGGRLLAWAGGAAILAGLVFLFAIAVSRGWIGEGARTLFGVTGALALGAVGVWLQEHEQRTDAA